MGLQRSVELAAGQSAWFVRRARLLCSGLGGKCFPSTSFHDSRRRLSEHTKLLTLKTKQREKLSMRWLLRRDTPVLPNACGMTEHSLARRRDQVISRRKQQGSSLCPLASNLQMRLTKKYSAVPSPKWMVAIGPGAQWRRWCLRSDRCSGVSTCANATLRPLMFRRCRAS